MATRKYILLIDMDGVAVNWVKAAINQYKTLYPYRPQEEFDRLAENTSYLVEDALAEEHKADLTAITLQTGFYLNMEPMVGAIEALKDMENNCQAFLEPYLCSAPEMNFENQGCHSEKAAWVEKHLGPWWTKRLILAKDKTLVRGHFLIDDKPEITGVMDPVWARLVFDQPYNQHMVDDGRFAWADWPEFKHFLRQGIKPQAPTPQQEKRILHNDKRIVIAH